MNPNYPAFPFPSGPEPRVNEFHDRSEGMTYREWLAGMALQATLINNFGCADWEAIAKDTMKAVDALIAELNKP